MAQKTRPAKAETSDNVTETTGTLEIEEPRTAAPDEAGGDPSGNAAPKRKADSAEESPDAATTGTKTTVKKKTRRRSKKKVSRASARKDSAASPAADKDAEQDHAPVAEASPANDKVKAEEAPVPEDTTAEAPRSVETDEQEKTAEPKESGRKSEAEDRQQKPAAKSARTQTKRGRQTKTATPKAEAKAGKLQMVISYTPGEECRVAVVEDGKLEEFHAERASNISRVGNIYVGRITNVEPAIQAAFVDFGVDHHGFLHVSDVHPRYFPGEDDETTESVGKKTPRRERPPIQRCFRRGDEVLVQVLKEGVGTKGPTLTSYLSVPGRFLVMMPQMDKVGVSRKVEDEDQRREMRKILDQLDLPEGFGFILRTAGMERTKQELKRDLAYLVRLWKDMEARRGTGHKPRLLYSESDLLVRALRDMLAPELDEVVIDNDLALARAARFLKIVAPRSKVRLLQYGGRTPLFHAFGIEQQIALMHAREVPLPGGGRLVIDETEALVAIDVNSGKMRDARDAETNAYRTNCEAVEEICRQLKLRDLGGIVINDLIDMRLASHRKDVEQRFRERLKRDRARSTILPISNFGILEMTRQRMRGSHETVHFGDCPTCRGRGIVQKPDSVASDSLRNLAAMLDHEKVARVEMVVSPRVASELLSSRRKTLSKLERDAGKRVDVRVSETIPIDRVTFYAYDGTGADIEIESLPKSRPPKDLTAWELGTVASDDQTWATDLKEEEPVEEPELTPAEQAELAEMPAHPIEIEDDEAEAAPAEGGRKRRRRRRRRGRGDAAEAEAGPATEKAEKKEPAAEAEVTSAGEGETADGEKSRESEDGEAGRRRKRRRRRRRGGQPAETETDNGAEAPEPAPIEAEALDAPRGDSWDLPPEALPRITPPPAAAARRTPEESEPGAEPAAEQEEAKEEPAAETEGGDEDGSKQSDRSDRGRRRRRGRTRSGERESKGESNSKGEARPTADKPAKAVGDAKSEKTPLRTGGGYRKRSGRTEATAAEKPARSGAKAELPPSSSPPPPAAQAPAPGSGQPARPKRLLYSTRRKLTPAELARRPKPE